jgi:hypothetical protein
MKLDPRNLNITPEVVAELRKNYDTKIVFEDYFLDMTVYNGGIGVNFLQTFKQRLREAVEPDEVWKKKYLGKDVDGWEHLEQKLYRGPNPPEWAKPHELHWKIDIYYRPRTTPLRAKKRDIEPLGLLDTIVAGFVGIFLVETLFPTKEGESSFAKDALGSFAFMKYVEAKHENDQRRENEE